MENIKLAIEKLLKYGLEHDLLKKWDVVPARNSLMDLLNIKEPAEQKCAELNYQVPESPQEILDEMLDYAADKGILEKDTVTYRDLFDTKLMAQLMPRQSEVAADFWQTAENESIKQATNDYYALSQYSNYIRQDRIAKNMSWTTTTEYGDLEITINLSKPEKDPEAIADAKNEAETNYPQCYLCLENVGYPGRLDHPARQTHRVIPIELQEEQWFLQYSPYVYYNEHCIVFYEEHSPMNINEQTFNTVLDFVEQIPHYFLGSNADLPLVGGSILNHDHFQGGHHTFPMEKADIKEEFTHPDFPGVTVGIVDWPMSVIRLRAKDKEKLSALGGIIHRNWKEYSDLDRNIKAYTEGQRHNTTTPIARKNDESYELDLVLRNNRKSEEHPAGIFHPHQELHHIKKENIGLIEVMGRAILPGRLKEELAAIEDFLTGSKKYNRDNLSPDLVKHSQWIEEMLDEYGSNLEEEQARKKIKSEVGLIFKNVLEDAGVYKRSKDGQAGFKEFLAQIDIS
ncbi:UDP-glucose--hexose-1-phosphate uridylyltransferase [Halanaerobacter jeridensis]|uniref:Galactose-1-phosphate uridylyltransferase n=1 Tax=Halanaerobacter jeridensis TaxID=706427 RepID=A0A938XS38_9FIRM|nr:UDP-glucose--hexose-1-phosphate uridylyltransferase [Halanaerobacter jeridensis]MBM7556666.1 UDPglucose--hexose-1-phosphate uridylyltransferase [Halanaerobacter jeridensis]